MLAGSDAAYCAILQPGDVLPAHALALLADRAVSLGRPAILYADEDRLGRDGRRNAPLFKPAPSLTLMLSGTAVEPASGWSAAITSPDFRQGARPGARRCVWMPGCACMKRARGAESHRIPFILTHRRPDVETAPATALAAVASAHLRRTGLPARIAAGTPLRLRVAAPRAAQPRVAVIVPSTCRSSDVRRCLSAVLRRTEYADWELFIVVMGRKVLDPQQQRVINELQSDRRVRHLLVEADRFNYAIANNRGAAASDSPLICLLNDDVVPGDPGWLAALVGHLADPGVGVVGRVLAILTARCSTPGSCCCPRHWRARAPVSALSRGGICLAGAGEPGILCGDGGLPAHATRSLGQIGRAR